MRKVDHLYRVRTFINQVSDKDEIVFPLLEIGLFQHLQELVSTAMYVPNEEQASIAQILSRNSLMNNRWKQ